jgi:acetyltransferase-like isoleucine patch superfamily enzyme
MADGNIFFDFSRLKYLGENVIIGKTVRIRYPELVYIGDNCIIDDFTYISTALELKGYVHISAGCKLIGGSKSKVSMDFFSTFSPNVVVAAGSDDYTGGIATPLVGEEFKGNVEYGEVAIGKHCIIGSGSVILPNVNIGDGASVGALSLVNKNLDPWILYAGIPVRKLKERMKDETIALEKKFFERLKNG